MSHLKFTCLTCHVAFIEQEWQKEHFSSDWHRYNCKRKVAELPPISVEEFAQRILAQQTKIDEESNTIKSYCQPCGKNFATKNSYENHIKSKKHSEKEKISRSSAFTSRTNSTSNQEDVEDIEAEEVDSEEWEDDPIPPNNCLFCTHHSSNLSKNMKHMTTIHSFFVPDLQYCTNLEGLISYLGEKVGCGYQCLWCNEKSRNFHSVAGVQSHMRAKGHCMMKHEGETVLEYVSFYDYSSSYPDASEADPDQEAPATQQLVIEGYELVLPSGVTVGHRSLLRYYKQRVNPNRSLVVSRGGSKSLRDKLVMQYKALGWNGATTADVQKKARDLNFMRHVKSKHYMQLGVKANKMQHHFRDQVMF